MLSENIKKLRILRGLSQVDIAKALHVSKQCVSNWESGNIQPSIDMLLKLAEFFNASTDFLLGLDEQKNISVENLTETEIEHIKFIIKDLQDSKKL